MNEYQSFLKKKRIISSSCGFSVRAQDINGMLKPFQRDLTIWSLKRGRAAVFADCGLGKTPIQLEWSRHVAKHECKPVLIFAPLAVAKQTEREGKKFHVPVKVCRTAEDITEGVNITNYEMLHAFRGIEDDLGGIVLDESSILKSYDGSFRKEIVDFAEGIPFRLACTATPSPNDFVELINHAEFFGIMGEREIKAIFFSNKNQDQVQQWALKEHAKNDFWKWVASWAVALHKPSDIGDFSDDGYNLPPLRERQIIVDSFAKPPSGMLMNLPASTLRERQLARMGSVTARVLRCAELVNNSDEQWIIWCDLCNEGNALEKAILGSVQVQGSDSLDHKENSVLDFQSGKIRVIITKPSIAGHGINWQNCHNMAFVGLSDSYEKLYQATRRCWRFGQEHPVNSWHIISSLEGNVIENILRKERQAKILFENLIKNLNMAGQMNSGREEMAYMKEDKEGKNWKLMLGDCVERLKEIKGSSIGLSVFSPPFPGMYAYTNSCRDVGNCKSFEELVDHFSFMMPELMRVTIPGRNCAIHLAQGVTHKGTDGHIGIRDFRGRVIERMEKAGWIYYGEVCIDKNPQIAAVRTKAVGLLFKTLSKDSSILRMGLADYILQFKKPGDNPLPIVAGKGGRYNTDGWITPDEWIEWAAPVWYRASKEYPGGIRETDVLSARAAKDNDDEKHLCPLQLGVIERCVKLWSNPGDTILSPFAGIGSEGWVSLRLGRKFIGVELKKSYFNQAIKNLNAVKESSPNFNLFQALSK